jgi:hypothetical protein
MKTVVSTTVPMDRSRGADSIEHPLHVLGEGWIGRRGLRN